MQVGLLILLFRVTCIRISCLYTSMSLLENVKEPVDPLELKLKPEIMSELT